jgi:hypothetical protein
MATTFTTLPDDAVDLDDFPARLATPALVASAIRTPSRGVSLGLDEEARIDVDDDGPELRDVGPDGHWPDADEWDRYSAAMALWINGRGPRPE